MKNKQFENKEKNPLLTKPVMTRKEICAYYGISISTLRRYLKMWGMYDEHLQSGRLVWAKYLRVIAEHMKE